ncbi:PLDc N-terminal domain-containing protein [Marisediminicola senii]|uniref:PLDc N-terminal domain-containing protein n=1 Tax=Marisediminicola senii TaxID=2711233 RepID=UPI0013E9D015
MPDIFNYGWTATIVLALSAAALAIISIYKAREHIPQLACAIWVLVALAFPLVGPLSWFLIGRRSLKSTA